MQLSIFFLLPSTDGALRLPFQKKELVGSNAFLVSFGCQATKCSSHLLPYAFAGIGGLKWTRTIDLTLIRRVL